MTSFADTVRHCFPAPSVRTRELVSDGVLGAQTREGDDLARGNEKVSLQTIVRSYSVDWLLVVILWGVLIVLERSGGHKREFSLNDISIQHSFAEHERVPLHLLVFISVGIPLLVVVPISVFVARNGWDVHNSLIGLFMSYTMTGVVTQIVKMSGLMMLRCMDSRPSRYAQRQISAYLTMVSRAFLAGTALAISFAGLGFLAFYLAGKMHLWDKRGHRTRAWFALSPLLGGAMVAISRTEDNRHHWQDVLVGSVLGIFISWVSYRTYYPSLRHPQCNLPLAPRVPDDDYDGDEETGLPGVRLLSSDENGTRPRPSEEEVAWRNGNGGR